MQRIKYKYQFNLIRDAISLLPAQVKPYLEIVDFVFDYSPKWVGLHNYSDMRDGRSYLNTCHCSYEFHTSDKKTTIVLYQKNIKEYRNVNDVLLHEIAHAIHERLNFFKCDWVPLSNYEKNSHECFACSFVRWLYPDKKKDSWGGNQELQRKYDKRPIEFFDKLLMKGN